jgi:hypothetical protein
MATVEGFHDAHAETLRGTESVVEGVGGIGAVVLSIIALTGTLSLELAAIAAIAVGIALVAEGGTIASRFWRMRAVEAESADLGAGMSAELLGGMAGAVLGLLAVLHIAPAVLVPVAAIVFGAAVLLGNGTTSWLSVSTLEPMVARENRAMARETLRAAAGAQILVGIAAVALGIIATVGTNPVVLSAVAFLALGGSLALGGTAIGGVVMSELRR